MARYIERIVDGLLSIVATMRVLPVIRCPPGEAAQMVAERLEENLAGSKLVKMVSPLTDSFDSVWSMDQWNRNSVVQERIRELLNRSGGVAAELFAAARAGAEVPGGSRSLVRNLSDSREPGRLFKNIPGSQHSTPAVASTFCNMIHQDIAIAQLPIWRSQDEPSIWNSLHSEGHC